MCITLPNKHPNMRLRILSLHPRNRPEAAISLMSPPPMPLPFVTMNISNRKRLTAQKPIIYSRVSEKGRPLTRSRTTFKTPHTNIAMLNPMGISYVRQSTTDSAISAEITRQARSVFSSKPIIINESTHMTPFRASIIGYCAEMCAPQYLHRHVRISKRTVGRGRTT